jgi:DNA sulfur modification protein DndD
MKIINVDIRNFKLLENVKLTFSLDPNKPLTLIRAENGSGKTSILYALLWVFYGMEGLPLLARELRLASSTAPKGIPVEVSVMVEFNHSNYMGEETRFRLLRSVIETPNDDNKVDRQTELIRLTRITNAGEEHEKNPEALIRKLVPLRLKDVFFTNGDDVQRFISGQVSDGERQRIVHESIRSLLGIDKLNIAKMDTIAVTKRLRSKAAKAGGSDTEKLELEVDTIGRSISELEKDLRETNEKISNMSEAKIRHEKELLAIHGIGDLDRINARIKEAEKEKLRYEENKKNILRRMQELLKSVDISWLLMNDELIKGYEVLSSLADINIIPGVSVEILKDRLNLGKCICGELLEDNGPHRRNVEALVIEQEKISSKRQRLTQLFHLARNTYNENKSRREQNNTFIENRHRLLDEYTKANDGIKSQVNEIKYSTEQRERIDEDRVSYLTEKIKNIESKLRSEHENIGRITDRLSANQEHQEEKLGALDNALKVIKIAEDLSLRRDVAEDISNLVAETLKVLENEYVVRVSNKMNELFLTIVGSIEELDSSIFTNVYIDKDYNIRVGTHSGNHLDTDFELNGASQRALTLSFIWALMEASGTTSPRIIDTPLGMVAGGVKTRMVDVITKPNEDLEFQVVLLLTRSEIRDIEELLDQRAGIVQTLTCSSHYPEDLINDWKVDYPVSRVCSCNHRQSCQLCARRYDQQHGVVYKG